MASEYLKWKYRDVRPDKPVELTPKQKRLNWWHYHKWHVVLGVTLLQLIYFLAYFLLAPWTLLLIPFLGLWYITFLAQFLLYDQINRELHIEEQQVPKTGEQGNL